MEKWGKPSAARPANLITGPDLVHERFQVSYAIAAGLATRSRRHDTRATARTAGGCPGPYVEALGGSCNRPIRCNNL